MALCQCWHADTSSEAVQVADLQPGGALHQAVTSGSQDLQLHLPNELRRQYLHELFPDLSVHANYEEEAHHHQLVVPRDEFVGESPPAISLNANVTRYKFLQHQCDQRSARQWELNPTPVIADQGKQA